MSASPAQPLLIALIAGEESGDQLGAELILALRRRHPQARFVGIGGRRMLAEGFESWFDLRELSLFGLVEVLRHLPRLFKLRRTLLRRLIEAQPALVIGIDAPDFNLGLERRLHAAGLRTAHYVSPSVWAWREQRVTRLGRSAEQVLCLFPMEPPIYARYGIHASFVGHPLARRFPLRAKREPAREYLQLPPDRPVLAVLPGSRAGEIRRLAPIFIAAARQIAAAMPQQLLILIPAAHPEAEAALRPLLADWPAALTTPRLLSGQAHQALLAADVALLASGTAALEAMLAKRPMVVGYKVSPLSLALARGLKMLRTEVYSLPNILARHCGLGEQAQLVPELVQEQCTPDRLAAAVLALFADSDQRRAIVRAFEILHHALLEGADGAPALDLAAALAPLLPALPPGAADA